MLLLSLKSPLVLLADLRLLLGCEIILDVKNLADLLRSLVLDHVGNSLASKVEQSLDVEVVCSQDEVEEGGLVDLDELGVKALEVLGRGGGCSGGGGVGVSDGAGVSRFGAGLDVLLAVLDDLGEDLGVDVGERDPVVGERSCGGWSATPWRPPPRPEIPHRLSS